MPEYRAQFPDAPTVTDETRSKIKGALTGIVRSEETRKRVSENRKGIRPQGHARYVKGAYSPTVETRQKMAEARRGQTHTEETKRKIGAAHRDVKETPEAVETNRQAQLEYWKDKPGSFFGHSHTDRAKEKQRLAAIIREAAYTPEFKHERAVRNTLGKRRTPEQRENYRRARLKYMEENPEAWQRFVETNLEVEFKAWCDEMEIECQPQYFLSSEGGTSHPYDFYLPEYHVLVECDGPHHWEGPWWTKENREETLKLQQADDICWTEMAQGCGYTVVRLRGRNSIGDEGSGSIDEQMLKVLGV